MRILLASTWGAGNIGPLVPFALACKRAGHDALIAAPRSAWEHVSRSGVPFAGVDDPPRDVDDAGARAAYPGMLALVRRWRPDVILRETLELASLLAAEKVGVPVLRVDGFLAEPEGIGREPLARLRREFGLCERPHDNRYLTLAPASLDAGRPGALRFCA